MRNVEKFNEGSFYSYTYVVFFIVAFFENSRWWSNMALSKNKFLEKRKKIIHTIFFFYGQIFGFRA